MTTSDPPDLPELADLAERVGRQAASLLLAAAVRSIVSYAFWSARQFQPRRKAAVAALAALDPEAAALVRRWATSQGSEAFAAAEALARRVLGVDTFFDWASTPDPVGE